MLTYAAIRRKLAPYLWRYPLNLKVNGTISFRVETRKQFSNFLVLLHEHGLLKKSDHVAFTAFRGGSMEDSRQQQYEAYKSGKNRPLLDYSHEAVTPNEDIRMLTADANQPLGYHFYLHSYPLIMRERTEYRKYFKRARVMAYDTEGRKKFLCLNLKDRPHRRALVDWLKRTGLFAEGHVSAHFAGLTIGQDAGFVKQCYAKPGRLPTLVPDHKKFCSFFEIVTETCFDSHTLFISEKTLRPILRVQPFIVLGSAGTLKALRDYGFCSFAPYIDESYDREPDPCRRMDMVFSEIYRLCCLDDIEAWYKACRPTALYNLSVMQKLVRRGATGKLLDVVDKLARTA